MKTHTIVLMLVLSVAIAAAAVFTFRASDTRQGPYQLHPDDASVVAAGATIYATHCASCHGAQLQGQPDWQSRGSDGLLPAPPHDASGHTWHHDDKTLIQITKLGMAQFIRDKTYKTTMPVYADILSDAQIIAVLSWIKAQWPAEIRKSNDRVNTERP